MASDSVVMDQHLQSKFLVRRFADDSQRLRFYDMKSKRTFVASYGRAGRGGAFTPSNPALIEALWGAVESAAPAALASVDEGTIFDRPDHIQTLKHLVALHFFRTSRLRKAFEVAVDTKVREAFVRTREQFGDRFLPELETVSGQEGLNESSALVVFNQYFATRSDFDQIFQELEEDWFARAGIDVGLRGLEVVDARGALVLSDRGAIPFGLSRGSAAPFTALEQLALPVGRHLLLGLGSVDGRRIMDEDETRAFNAHQFDLADAWAFSHPEDNMLAS